MFYCELMDCRICSDCMNCEEGYHCDWGLTLGWDEQEKLMEEEVDDFYLTEEVQ